MTSVKEVIKEFSQLHLPELFVFDLDYTLWPFWVDTHVQSPFSKDQTGQVVDYFGRQINMYPGVEMFLKELKDHKCKIAAASRTDDPKSAHELLHITGIHDVFDYKEIYPGRKTAHFKNFLDSSGVAYRDMIFFDDELRNIQDIKKLGVTCVHVFDGVSLSDLAKGLEQHQMKL